MPMPADPDLDALDALLKAANPGTWVVRAEERRTASWFEIRTVDGHAIAVDGGLSSEDAALIAAAVNALPALLRRARIGDAAREVLEMEAKLEAARAWFTAACRGEDVDESQRPNFVALDDAADAARARYRALLETKDA